MIHDATPLPLQCDSGQYQSPPYDASFLASQHVDLPAFADYRSTSRSDIDVPPELSESDSTVVLGTPGAMLSGGARVVELDGLDPADVARLFSSPPPAQTSNLTAQNTASPILDRYHSQGSDSQREPFELPPELFNSAVDVHARKWLSDFCDGS
ncbi:uncharacterized protein A1O5_04196 [Cladophialophora psammophila CBS 110553]|uniref:Uncharacterized protein n=1 Tax=Cladophialophora psammophila CBS 110553 TaxID=1182543 RepID=W9WXV2_9EURO|nr:uncharacterized protein A1O5_04196 [Cladophialophora psammophila CBS 110553]EXJ73047.1 hypothetical protein A1O5_04196 [Cladophialophora psammophila CBS 110553]